MSKCAHFSVYKHTHTHMYGIPSTCTYAYTNRRIAHYSCTHCSVHTHIHTHTYMYTHMHTHTHTRTHTKTHVHTHEHTHAHIHTHIHTHTHTQRLVLTDNHEPVGWRGFVGQGIR